MVEGSHCNADALLTQLTIGPIPSPLLLEYTHHALALKLVDPLTFLCQLPAFVPADQPLQVRCSPSYLSKNGGDFILVLKVSVYR